MYLVFSGTSGKAERDLSEIIPERKILGGKKLIRSQIFSCRNVTSITPIHKCVSGDYEQLCF